MSKQIIDKETGEITEKVVFRSMWCNPVPYTGIDLSNEFEEVFEEVAPYAIDVATGEIINKSSVPTLISKGKVNVQERINSFAKEVDLYSILEKFAYSEDPSIINVRQCQYGDIASLPNNLNDFAVYVNNNMDKLKEMNPELATMVVDPNISSEAIQARANEIMQERIKAFEPKKGENE